MELDEIEREPNLNLSAQEFRSRRNTKRCLKCARIAHIIKESRNAKEPSDHTALWKIRESPANATSAKKISLHPVHLMLLKSSGD